MIEFPLRLRSDIDELKVAEDLNLRRLSPADSLRLLKIADVEFDTQGRMTKYVAFPGCLITFEHLSAEFHKDMQFCSSNYVIEAANEQSARDFNVALKLAGNSCSSLYIGYVTSKGIYFLSPPGYHGECPLSLTEDSTEDFVNLVKQSRVRHQDPKFELMCSMLVYAMSTEPRPESRFIELAIILEMLLLPASNAELSYRFALRLAKLCNGHMTKDIDAMFRMGKKIYEARSKIVHTGRYAELESITPPTIDLVRKLLSMYATRPASFTEAALDALCLKA